jgi:hypothetical protein
LVSILQGGEEEQNMMDKEVKDKFDYVAEAIKITTIELATLKTVLTAKGVFTNEEYEKVAKEVEALTTKSFGF